MDKFTGAWRLVSFEERQPNGEIIHPYGEHPVGLLVYDASGIMSVQVMRRDRPSLSSGDLQQVASEEIKSAVEGFTAFFGSYEVNEEKGTITHHTEGHLLPNSVGKKLVRSFEFEGDRLVLKPSENRRVIWKRIR